MITIEVKKITPAFLVLRIIVRIIATITNVKMSPNDARITNVVSTDSLTRRILKYLLIASSSCVVKPEATSAVRPLNAIIKPMNWGEWRSTSQHGQN
jgi:hypothetical protein